jgi:hypothetical protein
MYSRSWRELPRDFVDFWDNKTVWEKVRKIRTVDVLQILMIIRKKYDMRAYRKKDLHFLYP